MLGHGDEEGRSDRDQHVRALAGRLAASFALITERTTEKRRGQKANEDGGDPGWIGEARELRTERVKRGVGHLVLLDGFLVDRGCAAAVGAARNMVAQGRGR
jgi:hypothetical protein